MAEPILSVRELHTHFFADEGVVRAVDGTSFDLFPGRTLGIVGESGCGKSVTARSILRIVERPGRIVSGEILLHRADGTTVDLVRLASDGTHMRAIRGGEIGLVFQEPMSSLSAYHTIGNQLIEAIRLHSALSKRAARARGIELLAMVGIPRPEQRVDAYSFELSGGLRQRVMIALALAGEPRILIADEPTTALDVTTQAQILDLLRRIQQERGMAIMLITHNLGVVAEMADDVVVMYLGRVVEEAPSAAIYARPLHPYSAALLTAVPDTDANKPRRRILLEGDVPSPSAPPPGCHFHPRCPLYAQLGRPEVCRTTPPELTAQAGSPERAACHFAGQLTPPA